MPRWALPCGWKAMGREGCNCCCTTGCASSALLGVEGRSHQRQAGPWLVLAAVRAQSCPWSAVAQGDSGDALLGTQAVLWWALLMGISPQEQNLGSLQQLQPFSWCSWCKPWQVSPCVVSPGLTVSLVASRVSTSRGELPFFCPAPLTSHVLSAF